MSEVFMLTGAAGFLALLLWPFGPKKASPVFLIPPFILFFAIIFGLFQQTGELGVWRSSWLMIGKNPAFDLVFQFSSQRLIPSLLSSFLSLLILWFSLAYLHRNDDFGYFTFLITLFVLAMAGLFCAANLFTLLLAWEWVGLCSYLLVQYWYRLPDRPQSAWRVVLINKVGDVSLIIGFALWLSQSYVDLPLATQASLIGNLHLSIPAASFLVLAAFVKSAQFPFSIWLKEAMAGPTSVSALLHSATMVVAGVWLLVQISPILPSELFPVLTFIGLATFLVANSWAVSSSHLKNLLAFSTMAQLGLMVSFIGFYHAQGALMHMHTHAFFKAGLFLVCGYLMHQAEKEGNLSGLDAQFIPFLGPYLSQSRILFFAFLFLLAALGGWPITSGFLSKEAGVLTWQEAQQQKWGMLAYFVLQVGLALSAFYTARLIFFMVHKHWPTSSRAGMPFTFLLPIVVLALGSGFWLVGPNPISAGGWLSAALQLHISSMHFEPYALVLGSLAGGIYGYKNGFADGLHPIQRAFDGLLEQNLNLFRSGWRMLWAFGNACRSVDQKVLDLALVRFSQLGIVGGYFSAFFDRVVVDGVVLSTVKIGRLFGQIFWSHSRQSPQGFAFFVVFFLISCILLLLIF